MSQFLFGHETAHGEACQHQRVKDHFHLKGYYLGCDSGSYSGPKDNVYCLSQIHDTCVDKTNEQEDSDT